MIIISIEVSAAFRDFFAFDVAGLHTGVITFSVVVIEVSAFSDAAVNEAPTACVEPGESIISVAEFGAFTGAAYGARVRAEDAIFTISRRTSGSCMSIWAYIIIFRFRDGGTSSGDEAISVIRTSFLIDYLGRGFAFFSAIVIIVGSFLAKALIRTELFVNALIVRADVDVVSIAADDGVFIACFDVADIANGEAFVVVAEAIARGFFFDVI